MVTNENGIICDEISANNTHVLILLNDDINDMDHVSQSVIEVVGYYARQGIEKMTEAHNNGSSRIRIGSLEDLTVLMNEFYVRNITTTIEPLTEQ